MTDPAQAIIEAVNSAWAQLLALGGLIVWLANLHSQTRSNKSELGRVWAQRQEDRAQLDRQRTEDMNAHIRAREDTNALLSEVRGDVKKLLERRSKE